MEIGQTFERVVAFVGEVGAQLTHRILDTVASKEHDMLEKRVRITHDTGGILDIAGRVGKNRTVRPKANRLPSVAEQGEFALFSTVRVFVGAGIAAVKTQVH